MSILFLLPFVHEKNTVDTTFYAPFFRRSKGEIDWVKVRKGNIWKPEGQGLDANVRPTCAGST
jgi:hypothetical protein